MTAGSEFYRNLDRSSSHSSNISQLYILTCMTLATSFIMTTPKAPGNATATDVDCDASLSSSENEVEQSRPLTEDDVPSPSWSTRKIQFPPAPPSSELLGCFTYLDLDGCMCYNSYRVPLPVKRDEAMKILQQAKDNGYHEQFVNWEFLWLFSLEGPFIEAAAAAPNSCRWYEEFRRWLGAREHVPINERICWFRRFVYWLSHTFKLRRIIVNIPSNMMHVPAHREYLLWLECNRGRTDLVDSRHSKDDQELQLLQPPLDASHMV